MVVSTPALTVRKPRMHSDNVASAVLRTPRCSLVAFELPVITSSTATAVAVAGGVAAIQRVASTLPSTAIAYLRPDDIHSHGIVGKKNESQLNLLLRLTPNSTTGGPWMPEIVGRIATTYTFNGAADFQYINSSAASCQDYSLLGPVERTTECNPSSNSGLPGSYGGFSVPPAEFVSPVIFTSSLRRDPKVYLHHAEGLTEDVDEDISAVESSHVAPHERDAKVVTLTMGAGISMRSAHFGKSKFLLCPIR